MTIKKTIETAIAADNGIFELKKGISLRRYTTDAMGYTCDKLFVDFTLLSGFGKVNFSREIISRDYDGVMSEIQKHTTDYLNDVAELINSELANGHR